MKLTANTLVVRPGTFEAVSLAAGSDVPEWATDLIGAHLIADDTQDAAPEAPKAPKAPQGDGESTDGQGADAKSDTPDASWTVAELREFAKANDISLEGATAKADILTAIQG